ncbi:MAG: 30S ribosomal protein S6 [Deltaproteobacteria bacterium]|jgi:small subunit ribosomal protein S6|nr:30S ribosomal protein S6 [Deltaproteobacteria bacterium]
MTEEIRKYELLYIHPGNLDEEGVQKVENRLAEIVERFSARIFHREDWGVRTLAYRVRKHDEGRYILLRFEAGVDCLREIERHLKIMDEVIKFLTVRLPDDFDENEGKKAAVEEEAAGEEPAAAAEPAPAGEPAQEDESVKAAATASE